MKQRIKNLSAKLGMSVFAQFLFGTAVFGMCCGFFPPSRSVTPANNTKTLVVYQNGIQHLIVQPEFSGAIEDFGLVMPAPSQPDVSEAPEDLFTKLEDYTNPKFDFNSKAESGLNSVALDLSDASEKKVTVIDRKDVGQYTATILKANDASELNKWLSDNGYESDELRDEIMEYYVQTNGYFVALKVNMSKVDDNAVTNSKPFAENDDRLIAPWPVNQSFLDPIDISYETDAPRLPTRLLAATPTILDYTVYTLSAEPYIIPGGDVQYSKKISLSESLTSEAKVLLPYNPSGQWLVRNKISIDPELAKKDLTLTRIADAGSSNVSPDNARRNVNPGLWEKDSGVTRQDCFTRGYRDDETDEYIYPEQGSVDACTFEHSFDLGYGEVNQNSGPPILNTIRVLGVAIIGLLAYQRYRAMKIWGAMGLIPRPDRTIKNAVKWLDDRTNHKLLGKKNELTPPLKAVRNVLLLVAGFLLSRWLIEWIEDGRFSNNTEDILVWLGVAPFFFTAGLTIFITPTALKIKNKGKGFWPYIITLGAIVLCVWIVTAIFRAS